LRWFVQESTDSEVVLVRHPYSYDRCRLCGIKLKIRDEPRAGRPSVYCDECPCSHGNDCELPSCADSKRAVYRTADLKRRSNIGHIDENQNIVRVERTCTQDSEKHSGLSVNVSQVFGVLRFRRCANPDCVTKTFCINLDSENERHRQDLTCHHPAWISGKRQLFCSDSCRKYFTRNHRTRS